MILDQHLVVAHVPVGQVENCNPSLAIDDSTDDLLHVPLSLAVLLALGSFGPWGAESLSLTSQMTRLTEVLTRTGILQGGRIVPAEEAVAHDDAKQISSIVTYLRNSGKEDALTPWFAGSKLNMASSPYAKDIVEAMGVVYQLYDPHVPGFHFYAQQNANLTSIEGFERMGRAQIYAYNDQTWTANLGPDEEGEIYGFRFEPLTGRFVVSAPDGAALEVDLNAFVMELGESGSQRAVEDFTLDAVEDPLRIRLVFQDLNGTLEDERVRIYSGNFKVLIDRTDR